MDLLLDTHIWLWHVNRSSKLPPAYRRAIETSRTPPWLSPVSIWELGALARKGRVEARDSLRGWVTRAFASFPVREATVTTDVALVSEDLAGAIDDPSDRLIAATAIVYGATLMTRDAALLSNELLPVFRGTRRKR